MSITVEQSFDCFIEIKFLGINILNRFYLIIYCINEIMNKFLHFIRINRINQNKYNFSSVRIF